MSCYLQMASTKGFEPLTARLEGVCSIQLSYVDITFDCLVIISFIFMFVNNFFKKIKEIKNLDFSRFNNQMASTKGFEPLTARLEGVCSIQLSYVDITFNCSNRISCNYIKCNSFLKIL